MSVYTKNVWTDNVTMVDKAHMDVIENGVFASQFRDEKGVANGYASLDSGVKVPVAQLPAGTASGVASLDATGKVPVAQLPANAAGAPTVTYGASPPGSPVNGDLWMFPADATNGVIWQFRYNSSSASAYKWEFVGGSPIIKFVAAFEGTLANTSNGWTWTATTPGPDLNAPRAGDYICSYCGQVNVPASGGQGIIGVANASVSSNPIGPALGEQLDPNRSGSMAGDALLTGVASANTMRVMVFQTVSGCTFGQRSISVTPVRVS